MTFQPLTKFVITRQIYNLRDFGQVYVQSTVRDASTDELLLTANMVESPDEIGRFKYNWTLPDDSSGTGRQLRVITVVYSDSGYITRDTDFEVEETDVLVRDMNILGGGGESINYSYIQTLFEKVLKGLPTPEDYKPKFDDLSGKIEKVTSNIKFPDKIDITPLYGQLDAIRNEILSIPKTKSYDQELNIIISGLNDIFKSLNVEKSNEESIKIEELKESFNDLEKIVKNIKFESDLSPITKELSKIKINLLEILDYLDEISSQNI